VSGESGRCASSKEQTKEKWRTTQLEVRFGGGKGSTRCALLFNDDQRTAIAIGVRAK
jgi:hypothetical protein